MIQKQIRNDRGEMEDLSPHDPRYWEGPYRFEPFPRAVYRATIGKGFTDPEARMVKDAEEFNRLMSSGWVDSPEIARSARSEMDADIAREAAESAYADRNMSERAQAERQAHEARSFDHVVDVPAPKKRPGRPKKIVLTDSPAH